MRVRRRRSSEMNFIRCMHGVQKELMARYRLGAESAVQRGLTCNVSVTHINSELSFS